MKYHDYLKTLTSCPFCSESKDRILLENNEAFLTYSRAPYHKYHLLVIPKRHVEYMRDLTLDESVSATALVMAGVKSLDKLGHTDCSVLIRDGKSSGKSIMHLHYNIIPGGVVTDITVTNSADRQLLNEDEEKSLVSEFKAVVENL